MIRPRGARVVLEGSPRQSRGWTVPVESWAFGCGPVTPGRSVAAVFGANDQRRRTQTSRCCRRFQPDGTVMQTDHSHYRNSCPSRTETQWQHGQKTFLSSKLELLVRRRNARRQR